jgi:hypothetical protein
MNLPETTTDRLLAVADIIELEPEKWEQHHHYFHDGAEMDDDNTTPFEVAGRETLCGTTACIAGWAIVLNPQWQKLAGLSWHDAGLLSLGLADELAMDLFDCELRGEPTEVADLLRHIAKLPVGHRTVSEVEEILPDHLVTVLRSGMGGDD